ncbi:MAG: TetR/AcrR family transcriptional regulator [Candidatus Electryonea clarkiae]|nr:TetR/AcrR family transcriptional regulator [Candidatus Electryonea clarkiae]MDP8289273.1 TetR/AcrR family transcriptional regulator [Candidatus Electryonea clarkiae]
MEEFTERQQQIIHESIELIADKGIQGLTIKNLSGAVGISEPAIYRHFKNKNEIVLGVMSVLKNVSIHGIVQKIDGLDAFSRVKLLFEELTIRFCETPSLTAIIFSEEIFNNEDLFKAVRERMEKSQKMLISILKAGQGDGSVRKNINAEQLSIMIIGSFRFLVTRWRIKNYEFDLKANVKQLLSTLERVVKP